MNVRRAVSWFRRRLVAMAEAGNLRVRWERKWVDAVDADDVDAWLLGRIPPSHERFREGAADYYRSLGVDVVVPS